MKHRLFRLLAVVMVTALFNTGCMLSRLVDRAFLGVTVRRPTYADRKTTGIFLIPFTFVIDVATFPIQALLVVILGDNFPFTNTTNALDVLVTMRDDPRFQQLNDDQQAVAMNELQQLIDDKKIGPNSALALDDEGHWTVVELSADTREQLIARSMQPASNVALVCER